MKKESEKQKKRLATERKRAIESMSYHELTMAMLVHMHDVSCGCSNEFIEEGQRRSLLMIPSKDEE